MSVWPDIRAVGLLRCRAAKERWFPFRSAWTRATWNPCWKSLAQIGFPINPQIYHDAVIVYVYPDGHEETEATTLVEFPAYADRLEEVRRALESNGFDPDAASGDQHVGRDPRVTGIGARSGRRGVFGTLSDEAAGHVGGSIEVTRPLRYSTVLHQP